MDKAFCGHIHPERVFLRGRQLGHSGPLVRERRR
jgi:hypothetical protein